LLPALHETGKGFRANSSGCAKEMDMIRHDNIPPDHPTMVRQSKPPLIHENRNDCRDGQVGFAVMRAGGDEKSCGFSPDPYEAM
jgi:hypothetical protein